MKTVKTSMGDVPIQIPRNRESTFEPQIIKKHQRDVTSIEGKVLAMYGRGMSQRDIASTIEDIYGFPSPTSKSPILPTVSWMRSMNGRTGHCCRSIHSCS